MGTQNQGGDGKVRCWMIEQSEPGSLAPMNSSTCDGCTQATVIVTTKAEHPSNASQYPGIVFGEGGWQAAQGALGGSVLCGECARTVGRSRGVVPRQGQPQALPLPQQHPSRRRRNVCRRGAQDALSVAGKSKCSRARRGPQGTHAAAYISRLPRE